jgi:hypothetical protein
VWPRSRPGAIYHDLDAVNPANEPLGGEGGKAVKSRTGPARERSTRRRPGELNISLLGSSPRQTSWGDRQRWRLEDRLAQVLREAETQATEAEERRLAKAREEAELQRRWEAAMEDAKRRLHENHRLEVLRERVRAWREADGIRAYCDAVEARYGEPAPAKESQTAAWLRLARAEADGMQAPPVMPADPQITPEALKPFLGAWSPYGPRGW